MKKVNKKGFTLAELIGVITLIGVVISIATAVVLTVVTKIKKSALITEGVQAVEAAKAAYYDALASGDVSSKAVVCYDLQWLCQNNYYEKGCDGVNSGDNYSGSVMIKID